MPTQPQLWERWGHLANVGEEIACPTMIIIGEDHKPHIVKGQGFIRIESEYTWSYVLKGISDDVGYALKSLNRVQDDPYDGRLRSRLSIVDDRGVDILMGWTKPSFCLDDPGAAWTFTGECESASLFDETRSTQAVEDLFILPRQHRARLILRKVFPQPKEIGGAAEYRLPFANDEILFTLYDSANMLTIRSPTSSNFPAVLMENWLAEPLRVMFGQLVYPRIVARGQHERTMISIRPSPKWHAVSDACALWNGVQGLYDAIAFWGTYSGLLSYIAEEKGPDGNPNFEANRITSLYHEVIQAARSSRWLWALAHASAIEGLVLLIAPPGTRKTGVDQTEIADFCKHIDKWPGTNARLKEISKNAANRTLHTSVSQVLRELCDANVVTREQLNAWNFLRNRVMHGSLITPYSSAEADKALLDLSDLLHNLTRKLAIKA